ncbi:MAG TPA: TlpA disulfide reductase family protein [Gemmatimonadaceae bacterium]|jgi:thiol-disulfide isomerase/thioredoxin
MTHRAIARRIGALAFLSTVAISSRTLAQEGGISVGSIAPAAAVQTLDGKTSDLSQYIGKTPVVLEFWATWCPLCKKLEPSMQAAREKYEGRVTFVSVGVKDNQTAEKQMAYVNEKHIGGNFVFDRDGKAVAAYKAPHTSYVVVIDKMGKVVYTGVGPEQNIDDAVAKGLPMNGMKQ